MPEFEHAKWFTDFPSLKHKRSLLPKIDDLKIILELHSVDMAFITETWLNEKIDDAAVCIDGYSIVRRDRINKKGGGVYAFIKSSIPFKILTEFYDINSETLWLYLRPYISFIVVSLA